MVHARSLMVPLSLLPYALLGRALSTGTIRCGNSKSPSRSCGQPAGTGLHSSLFSPSQGLDEGVGVAVALLVEAFEVELAHVPKPIWHPVPQWRGDEPQKPYEEQQEPAPKPWQWNPLEPPQDPFGDTAHLPPFLSLQLDCNDEGEGEGKGEGVAGLQSQWCSLHLSLHGDEGVEAAGLQLCLHGGDGGDGGDGDGGDGEGGTGMQLLFLSAHSGGEGAGGGVQPLFFSPHVGEAGRAGTLH